MISWDIHLLQGHPCLSGTCWKVLCAWSLFLRLKFQLRKIKGIELPWEKHITFHFFLLHNSNLKLAHLKRKEANLNENSEIGSLSPRIIHGTCQLMYPFYPFPLLPSICLLDISWIFFSVCKVINRLPTRVVRKTPKSLMQNQELGRLKPEYIIMSRMVNSNPEIRTIQKRLCHQTGDTDFGVRQGAKGWKYWDLSTGHWNRVEKAVPVGFNIWGNYQGLFLLNETNRVTFVYTAYVLSYKIHSTCKGN